MSAQILDTTSELAYYSDENNHGNYQYVPISQMIDALTLEGEGDSDSYLKNVPRHLMIKYAIDGVRELSLGGNGDTLALELCVGGDLKFVLPQDFVDYLEVFVIVEHKLYLLEFNSDIITAGTFLQNDNCGILFDDAGDALESDGNNAYNIPHKRYEYGGKYEEYCGGKTNIDTSKLSKHGEFKVDKRRGCMIFSSDMEDMDIVVRYVSDGLQQKNIDGEKITVHKYLITALEDYMYFRSIARKGNVPANEKHRANQKFKTSKHKASILLKDINPHRIAKAMRSQFKPLKS